jgi:hypothetical protein
VKLTYLHKLLSKSYVEKLELSLRAMFYLQTTIKRSGGTRTRTGDTMIFSHVLYHLSYPAG